MTPMMRRALLVFVAIAVIAAGCGKESLAQYRFNTAAHELCKELQATQGETSREPPETPGVIRRIRALIYANRSLPPVARYLRDNDRVKALPDPDAVGGQAERLRKRRRTELRALGITSCLRAEPTGG